MTVLSTGQTQPLVTQPEVIDAIAKGTAREKPGEQSGRQADVVTKTPAEEPYRRAWNRFTSLGALAVVLGLGTFAATRPTTSTAPPAEIYQGVIYECIQLNDAEAQGTAHIITVDLTEPGIGLYITPLDPTAVKYGYQYRLAHAQTVADNEQLAVVVNGALFHAGSDWIPVAGEWATGAATVISDHQVSHIDPHSYLLWFDDQLIPHIETKKPPSADAVRNARWGISGKSVKLRSGMIRRSSNNILDSRTALAIDPESRRLWIAVFESSSQAFALQTLADRGATRGLCIDGGDSSCLVVGAEAVGARPGAMLGGHRPVATFFGVRASPLRVAE